MKRKLFSMTVLLLLVVCLVLTAGAEEAEVVKSGKFGSNETADNVTWKLYSDGTLIFSGIGATRDSQTYSSEAWGSSLTDIRHIIVEEGITYLGDYMFYNDFDNRYVETITLPSSIKEIGQGAFSGMPSLKGVYISDLAAWCRIQFEDTESNPLCNQVDLYVNGERIVDLVIPESITEIPSCAFYGSAGIHTVTLHKNVKKIGDYAFNSASCLKHMIFQGSEGIFGRHVFTLSELTIHYPAGVQFWEQMAADNYDNTLRYSPYEGTAPVLPDDPPCDRIIWNFDPDTGTLTLSGYGHTGDFYSSNTTSVRPEWDFYSKYITTVIVEEGVTGLGEHTFQRCQDLTSVSLPSTLQSIGGSCFDQCIKLEQVNLPENLTYLGPSAFSHTALTSVVIPTSLTQISSGAFQSCNNLTELTLHDGITVLGDGAFGGCNLDTAYFPESLELLGQGVYSGNDRITSVVIPEKITVIPGGLFYGCSGLTSVTLHDGITEIGDTAFEGCDSLTEIDLPEGLLILGNRAFRYTPVDHITLPAGLMYYGTLAFREATELTFTGRAPEFAGDSFSWQELTVYYPAGYRGWEEAVEQNYEGTVTWIPYETELPEPDYHVHSYEEIVMPAACESWGGYHYVCVCGDFYDGERIPPLEHIWGPWRVITEATETDPGWRERVCTICGNPESGIIPVGPSQGTTTNISWHFDANTSTLTLSGQGHTGNFSASSSSEQKPEWHEYSGSATTLIVEEGITGLGDFAFYGFEKLRSVSLPNTLEIIGRGTFQECILLEQVTLPEGLYELGMSVFEHTSLATITIPGSLTVIPPQAFRMCTSLREIVFHDSITEIRSRAFEYCDSLTSITLPEGLQILENDAFPGNPMGRVTLPAGLITYGDRVIPGASELCFTGNAPQFWQNAFQSQTVTVYYPEDFPGWEEAAAQNSGGKVTWIPYAPGEALPEPHVHSFTEHKVEPTCNSNGYYYYVCECGYTEDGEMLDPLPHTYGPWIIHFEPDEERDGLQEHTCTRCGTSEQETIPRCPFQDVSGEHYFYQPVLWAVYNGITSGTGDGKFSPNATCTRAQVVTFLWRAKGSPTPSSTTNPFTDVAAGDYFYEAVLWAVENGITTGMNATTFAPNSPCNRAQVVTFLWRAMGQPTPEKADNPFSDVAGDQWYYTPVLWAVENGITTGTTASTFAPSNPCTRGQVVTFLYRAFSEK